MQFPKKLEHKLTQRKKTKALRTLGINNSLIDFSSNDYLGFAKSELIFNKAHQFLIDNHLKINGATGSRLLSGNYNLYSTVEKQLATFFNSEKALIFNSGYDANIGLFSSILQRNDIVLFDEFCHASIRDGILLSNAKSYKFKHNDLDDLTLKINRFSNDVTIYVVTESVFSMDGDSPDLTSLTKICKKHNALLIVDEAHAVGVFNSGLIEKLNLQNNVFARIVTFGKAFGCHGAAVLGSIKLHEYLINFARSFIYTTGLPPHALATIKTVVNEVSSNKNNIVLQNNITHFIDETKRLQLNFIASESAIHCCVISGNEKVKKIAIDLQEKGFDVKPILYPTVPEQQERLRFCLHSYNSKQEITDVLENLATFVNTL